ncbi:MAG: hypothetical protein HC929_19660 [Leptolyngbyaceae cyanobacterium SM2_5_2]|nr:hypothetical protein [Leptolyngbyaceae cyanobacterium SM2_5_2]
MLLSDLFPFPRPISLGAVAGVALWALAFYLGFSSLADRAFERGYGWFQSRLGKAQSQEAVAEVLASLVSLIPFLLIGGLAYAGLTLTLGGSWAVSFGLIASIGSGVYELGRRNSQPSK